MNLGHFLTFRLPWQVRLVIEAIPHRCMVADACMMNLLTSSKRRQLSFMTIPVILTRRLIRPPARAGKIVNAVRVAHKRIATRQTKKKTFTRMSFIMDAINVSQRRHSTVRQIKQLPIQVQGVSFTTLSVSFKVQSAARALHH